MQLRSDITSVLSICVDNNSSRTMEGCLVGNGRSVSVKHINARIRQCTSDADWGWEGAFQRLV
eukprot:1158823-Pelagomonas_calceolata.AAC.1